MTARGGAYRGRPLYLPSMRELNAFMHLLGFVLALAGAAAMVYAPPQGTLLAQSFK